MFIKILTYFSEVAMIFMTCIPLVDSPDSPETEVTYKHKEVIVQQLHIFDITLTLHTNINMTTLYQCMTLPLTYITLMTCILTVTDVLLILFKD